MLENEALQDEIADATLPSKNWLKCFLNWRHGKEADVMKCPSTEERRAEDNGSASWTVGYIPWFVRNHHPSHLRSDNQRECISNLPSVCDHRAGAAAELLLSCGRDSLCSQLEG